MGFWKAGEKGKVQQERPTRKEIAIKSHFITPTERGGDEKTLLKESRDNAPDSSEKR